MCRCRTGGVQVGVVRRRGQDASATALLTKCFLAAGEIRGQAVATTTALGLIPVSWILLLMAEFLFLSKRFPLVLGLWRLILPLLANDLGDLWIGKTRVLGNNLRLVLLTIEDES